MRTEYILPTLLRFIIVAALQVFVFNRLQVHFLGWDLRNALVFPLFIILLPVGLPATAVIIISFLFGLTIDLFSYSPGIYASTAVFLGFVRGIILRVSEPREGYKTTSILSPRYFKTGWYLRFVLIMVGIASLWYTFITIFSFKEPMFLLVNFVFVFLVSVVINLLGLYILNPKR